MNDQKLIFEQKQKEEFLKTNSKMITNKSKKEVQEKKQNKLNEEYTNIKIQLENEKKEKLDKEKKFKEMKITAQNLEKQMQEKNLIDNKKMKKEHDDNQSFIPKSVHSPYCQCAICKKQFPKNTMSKKNEIKKLYK